MNAKTLAHMRRTPGVGESQSAEYCTRTCVCHREQRGLTPQAGSALEVLLPVLLPALLEGRLHVLVLGPCRRGGAERLRLLPDSEVAAVLLMELAGCCRPVTAKRRWLHGGLLGLKAHRHVPETAPCGRMRLLCAC